MNEWTAERAQSFQRRYFSGNRYPEIVRYTFPRMTIPSRHWMIMLGFPAVKELLEE